MQPIEHSWVSAVASVAKLWLKSNKVMPIVNFSLNSNHKDGMIPLLGNVFGMDHGVPVAVVHGFVLM